MRKIIISAICLSTAICLAGCQSKEDYNVYFGNIHAHCNYSGDIKIFKAKQGVPMDPNNTPEGHFARAKELGYDFYCLTDHSQYPEYTQEAWEDIKQKAASFTDENFLAIRGYEHSENNGPDGTGHMNVFNSDTYLNALADSVSIEFFHNWLARPENANVYVSFNHPSPSQYNTFYCYNEEARQHMKTFEIINGKNSKYKAFIVALEKGWKVSPVAGCDNHGVEGIAKWPVRCGIWAKDLSYESWLDAIVSHRTFATFDKNLSVIYRVNGSMMGNEKLSKSNSYKFEIKVVNPDVDDPEGKITKIEIATEGGKVIASEEFSTYDVKCKMTVKEQYPYYYVLVYEGNSEEPTAFAAPVWVE